MSLLTLTDEAKKLIINAVPVVLGLPYKMGAETMQGETPYMFDCSELVEWLYRCAGWIVPDGARFQFAASLPVKDIETGDLLFTQRNGVINHVALALDTTTLVEASGWKMKVIKTPLEDFMRTYKIPEPGQAVNHSTVHPDGFRRFIMEKVKARP